MPTTATQDRSTPAIPFVEVAALDPETRALYERIEQSVGYVPNSMKTYLHRPRVAAALMGLSSAIYGEEEGGLPMRVQLRLGLICSAINGCAYCTSHQCSAAQNLAGPGGDAAGLSDDEVRALISGEEQGGDAVERVCFAYARAASFDANSVPQELLAEMREQLTAGQIVQLSAIVGMWKLFNTIHDSLHLPIEEDKAGYRHFFDEARPG